MQTVGKLTREGKYGVTMHKQYHLVDGETYTPEELAFLAEEGASFHNGHFTLPANLQHADAFVEHIKMKGISLYKKGYVTLFINDGRYALRDGSLCTLVRASVFLDASSSVKLVLNDRCPDFVKILDVPLTWSSQDRMKLPSDKFAKAYFENIVIEGRVFKD